jgi:hypothetical protein
MLLARKDNIGGSTPFGPKPFGNHIPYKYDDLALQKTMFGNLDMFFA